jgi:hypothetical protein
VRRFCAVANFRHGTQQASQLHLFLVKQMSWNKPQKTKNTYKTLICKSFNPNEPNGMTFALYLLRHAE